MAFTEKNEESNHKEDLEMFKSFDNNLPIQAQNFKETNGEREEEKKVETTQDNVTEEEKEMSFEEKLSKVENSEHREYIKRARQRMLEMMDLVEMPDWKELSSKDGTTIYTKMMEKNIKAVRGIGEIPFPAQLVGFCFTLDF